MNPVRRFFVGIFVLVAIVGVALYFSEQVWDRAQSDHFQARLVDFNCFNAQADKSNTCRPVAHYRTEECREVELVCKNLGTPAMVAMTEQTEHVLWIYVRNLRITAFALGVVFVLAMLGFGLRWLIRAQKR